MLGQSLEAEGWETTLGTGKEQMLGQSLEAEGWETTLGTGKEQILGHLRAIRTSWL